jgi:hypothetical protein
VRGMLCKTTLLPGINDCKHTLPHLHRCIRQLPAGPGDCAASPALHADFALHIPYSTLCALHRGPLEYRLPMALAVSLQSAMPRIPWPTPALQVPSAQPQPRWPATCSQSSRLGSKASLVMAASQHLAHRTSGAHVVTKFT